MERVGRSFGEHAVVDVGFPVIGAGIGWLLHLGSDRITRWEWVPLSGLWRWLAGWPEPQALLGFVGAGLVAGLFLTAASYWGYVLIGVEDDELVVRRGDRTRRARRAEITAIYADESGGLTSKHLVVLGAAGRELWRVRGDLPPRPAIGDYLTAKGLPWRSDGDPYADAYRRWVPDLPDLPDGANALLKARQRALERDDREDAEHLRADLAALGVVVRDDKTRQHVRRAGHLPGA